MIFNEVLYFGASLDHSLLNPNQVRHYGVRVYDNPYEIDPDRTMGIHLDDGLHFPFVTNGSTVFMETHYPSDDELQDNPHIVLTLDSPWDPHQLEMPGSIGSQNDLHDFLNRAVSSINNNYHLNNAEHGHEDNDLDFMSQLIHNRHACATMSESRHSKFTPDHVACVFGIRIAKAKEVLVKSTQRGI